MPLLWLFCTESDDIAVVIIPAPALVYARLDAAKKELDEGMFVEGHQLDDKLRNACRKYDWAAAHQDEAKRLLA
jgi:hypothetical protein